MQGQAGAVAVDDGRAALQHLGQAEIGHLDGVRRQQDVLRFDVPVLDGYQPLPQRVLGRVQIIERVRCLPHVVDQLVERNAWALGRQELTFVQALQEVLGGQFRGNHQRARRGRIRPIAGFVGDDHALAVQEPVGVHLHEVVVIQPLDGLQSAELVPGTAAVQVVNHLEGHRLAPRCGGFPDLAVAAAADLAHQSITGDDLLPRLDRLDHADQSRASP